MRNEATSVRNTSISSTSLDERHRPSRLRLSTEFVNHADSPVLSSPHGSSFDNSDSSSSCSSGNTQITLNRIKSPSPELPVKIDKQTASSKTVLPDTQSHLTKRRHGRMSPHLFPYSRSKTTRSTVSVSENSANASCSSTTAAPFHHSSSRCYHVSWDDQKPMSPPLSSNSSNSRLSRRRQRPRSDGKEDKSANNSDDEHDDGRLQRLNQGINYEEVCEVKKLKELYG